MDFLRGRRVSRNCAAALYPGRIQFLLTSDDAGWQSGTMQAEQDPTIEGAASEDAGPSESGSPPPAAPEADSEGLPTYLRPVTDFRSVAAGQVVRRIGGEKDQQGRFVRINDEGDGMIVVEVVDLKTHEYLAEVGVIRPATGDALYVHDSQFGDDPISREALDTVKNWSLLREHPELRDGILEFVQSAFSPAQIRDWKKRDHLRWLFVPIQHKFKIGRHKEKIDWDKKRDELFLHELRALNSGKHMTYVAFIPRDTNHQPMYYTYGTKPHLETMKQLEREPFAFRPNQGGHIKCVDERDGVKVILVDAGSNDLGAGMHTPLAIAEMVVEGLKKLYPGESFEYRPLPGREAFGLEQSY
jgi:hypothetical protein